MAEINLEATIDNIAEVTAFIDRQLEEAGSSMRAQMQIDVAIDELFGNIAHYAYNGEAGPCTVRFETLKDPLRAVVTFIDHGVPYNPLAKEDPDVTLSAEERAIGGLGIFLVKKTMDDMTYTYENGQNILSIIKKL